MDSMARLVTIPYNDLSVESTSEKFIFTMFHGAARSASGAPAGPRYMVKTTSDDEKPTEASLPDTMAMISLH